MRRFAQLFDTVCGAVSVLNFGSDDEIPANLVELFDPEFDPIGWSYIDGEWVDLREAEGLVSDHTA